MCVWVCAPGCRRHTGLVGHDSTRVCALARVRGVLAGVGHCVCYGGYAYGWVWMNMLMCTCVCTHTGACARVLERKAGARVRACMCGCVRERERAVLRVFAFVFVSVGCGHTCASMCTRVYALVLGALVRDRVCANAGVRACMHACGHVCAGVRAHTCVCG